MKRIVVLVALLFLAAFAAFADPTPPSGNLRAGVIIETVYAYDAGTVVEGPNTAYVPVNMRLDQAGYARLRRDFVAQWARQHPDREVVDVDADRRDTIWPFDNILGIEVVHRPKPKVEGVAKVEERGCRGCGNTITNNYYNCPKPVVIPAPKPAPKPRVRRPRPQPPCKPATPPNCTQQIPCPGGSAPTACGIAITVPCDVMKEMLAPPVLPPTHGPRPDPHPQSNSSIDVVAPKAMNVEIV